MVVLGEMAVSHKRGSPVSLLTSPILCDALQVLQILLILNKNGNSKGEEGAAPVLPTVQRKREVPPKYLVTA